MRSTKEYFDSIHRLGRACAIAAILIMLGIPTVISIVFGTFPGFLRILTAATGLLAIFIPVTISEVISYTPVLGSSAYLTFITGNILNLKLPVVANAQKVGNAEPGTEKGDVIATIAVSVSSLLTILLIALGTLLLVPLKPVLTSAPVQVATANILPALFGAMGLGILSSHVGGGIIIKGRLLGAIVPTLLVIVVYIISSQLAHQLQGFLVLICLPITYFGSRWLYKKGKITVALPGDETAGDE